MSKSFKLNSFSNDITLLFANVTYSINFALEIFYEIFRFPKQKHIALIVLLRQIIFTGYEALGLVFLSSIIIGALVIIQGSTLFNNFENTKLIYSILVTVTVREVGSLVTALIIISRSGSAIATELGNMVVNNEVEAIVSIGISPISYLIVPRVLAVVLSIIPLSIYFNLMAFISAGFVSNFFYGISVSDFASQLFNELQIRDLMVNLIKSFLFGFIISIITCYQGIRVVKASTEVPQRTSKAVVQSFSGVIVIDIILTIIFYF